jgi:predicted flavoprotein YhiN
MAAQACADAGLAVHVYDAMPSVGRKFLLAGKGGLNLTHAEPPDAFNRRYGEALPSLQPHLQAFGATDLRAWVDGLGIETFVGSSGRVFPREMKAAPLLRAWLKRLRQAGVSFHSRHRWDGRLAMPADRTGASRILASRRLRERTLRRSMRVQRGTSRRRR